MKRLQILALFLLPGCCMLCEEPRPPTVFHEEYLPFKQPNRDPSYPAMVTVRDEGDGFYWEMSSSMGRSFQGKEFKWGKRYKVEVTSRYNRVTQYSDRSITALLKESKALDGEFRLHSISAPYFGEDRRSFLDGKAFECSERLCADLDTAFHGKNRFDMVLEFGETVSAPLVLISVESPTCYNTMDCSVRQDCCEQAGAFVCVSDDICPPDKKVGIAREKYKKNSHIRKRSPPP